MNLRAVDLNLLVIFDALIEEKSITRAARRVGMTPSAMSHALQRLRRTFSDPLLQRTAGGMAPTQRARELAKPVRAALNELQHALAQQLQFDPAVSERNFTIHISDFLVACLLPRVCARIRGEAPGIRLTVEYLPSGGVDSYEPGDIQLRVDARRLGPEFSRKRIWRDPFVIAMRRDHPAVKHPMTLERYAALPQLEVKSVIIDTRPLDDVLDGKGLARRAAITIPCLAGVIAILEHTDLCAVLPARWVALYGHPGRLTTAPLPVDGIEYTVDMVWHRHDARDAGHRWLRTLIVEEFAVLYPGELGQAGSPDKLDLVPPRRQVG